MQLFKLFVFLSLPLLASIASAGVVALNNNSSALNTKDETPLKTVDKQSTVVFGGFIMWDYNYTKNNSFVDEDGFHTRRTRIHIKGKLSDWAYKAQFNVGNGNTGTSEDVYIRYSGFGQKAVVTAGKQREPFGLEALQSVKYISFLERSAVTEAYAPGRNEGVLVSGTEGNVNYAFGIFEDGDAAVDEDDITFTARLTYAPVKTDNSLVHVGVAASKRPDSIDVTGFEFAASVDGVHLQAEYMEADSPALSASAYYMQLGWFLTGEQRAYKKGALGGVKPNNAAKGAWELVARYEDGDGNFSDIELGNTDATSYGVGINYFANKNARLGVSYNRGKDNLSANVGSELRVRLQLVY